LERKVKESMRVVTERVLVVVGKACCVEEEEEVNEMVWVVTEMMVVAREACCEEEENEEAMVWLVAEMMANCSRFSKCPFLEGVKCMKPLTNL
jgi:hypothetical protein